MSSNRREFLKQAGIGGGVLLFGNGMTNAVAGSKEVNEPNEAGKHQKAIKKIIIKKSLISR